MAAPDLFRLLSSYIAFLAVLQVATLGMSLARFPLSVAAAWLLLGLSALGGVLAWRWQRPCSRGGSGTPPAMEVSPHARFDPARLVILAGIGVYGILWLVSIAAPDPSWDGNTYHIPTIHLWAFQGYVHWISSDFQYAGSMNGFPKGVEAVSLVLVKALGEGFVNTGNLVYLPLGILGIAFLARSLGASFPAALSAGSAYVLVPLNIAQGPTTYVDSGYASSVVAVFAAVIFARADSEVPGRALSLGTALSLGAAAGLAMGAKSTGLAVAGLGLAAGALICGDGLLHASGTSRSFMAKAGARFLLAAVLSSLAVGGYWYFRNYSRTGSPLYPAGLKALGHTVFPGRTIPQIVDYSGNTPAKMSHWGSVAKVLYVWSQIGDRDMRWPRNVIGYDGRYGGLGYLWVLGCLPAAGLMLMRRGSAAGIRATRFSWLLGMAIPAFLFTPMMWWPRFTIWLLGIGLPALAAASGDGRDPCLDPGPITRGLDSGDPALAVPSGRAIPKPRRIPCSLKRAWIILCVLVALLEGAVSLLGVVGRAGVRMKAQKAGVAAPFGWDDPRLLRAWLLPDLVDPVLEEILAGGDAVAVGGLSGGMDRLMGCLSRPVGRRKILPIRLPVDEREVGNLRSQGVRYVLWGDAAPPPDLLMQAASRVRPLPGLRILTLPTESPASRSR